MHSIPMHIMLSHGSGVGLLTNLWICREAGTELPFMGQDAPRPSTRPRWIDADEAMLKLLAIRQALCPRPKYALLLLI